MWMAMEKQATTITTHKAFAVFDLAVEMCTRPWIVELSKKSEITFKVILLAQWQQVYVKVFKLVVKV